MRIFPKGTDLFPTSPPARQSATRTQLFSSAFKNNHNHNPLQNVTHVLHHRPHPPSQQCGIRGGRERAKGTTSKSRSPFLPGRQGACNYTHALHDALPTRMSRPSCAPGTHGHGAGGGAIGEERTAGVFLSSAAPPPHHTHSNKILSLKCGRGGPGLSQWEVGGVARGRSQGWGRVSGVSVGRGGLQIVQLWC